MMYPVFPPAAETAGSLTPMLEGAPHSTAHTDRATEKTANSSQPKGGTHYS